MDRRHSRKGLQIIGAHVQNATDEQITEVVKDQRMGFPVTKGIRGPNLSNGIPHMAVFDVAGKLVYSGFPNEEADDVVRKALRDVGSEASGDDGLAKPKEKDLIEMRRWTSKDGNAMEAALQSVADNTGKFRRNDGKLFDVPLDRLSEADQKLIEEAASKKDESSTD